MSDLRVQVPRGRLLGIDHGAKIMGIAVSDALPMIARPLQKLARSTRERDFAALNAIILAQGVVGVVVGLPETPPDFDGASQAETVRNWAARLAAQVNMPVYLWDETLSTAEAERLLEDAGQRRRDRVDDVAAAVILGSFIEAHSDGRAYPTPVAPRRKAIKGQT